MSTLQSRFFNQVIVSVYKIQMEKKKTPLLKPIAVEISLLPKFKWQLFRAF